MYKELIQEEQTNIFKYYINMIYIYIYVKTLKTVISSKNQIMKIRTQKKHRKNKKKLKIFKN